MSNEKATRKLRSKNKTITKSLMNNGINGKLTKKKKIKNNQLQVTY